MSKLFLVYAFLAAIAPDLLLLRRPRWSARLAFRRMSITRRFALARGPRVPTDRAAYREDALPRVTGELPVITDPIELAHARLIPDGPGAFVLSGGWQERSPFVVRIDARVERGDVVLRARQAPSFVLFPFVAAAGLAWLHAKNPGREVGVIVVAIILGATWLGHFLFGTTTRDLRTAQAMEHIEHAFRSLAHDDAARVEDD